MQSLDRRKRIWYYHIRGLHNATPSSRGYANGKIWLFLEKQDPLAQLAEHLTFNQGVRSSSLRWVTILVALRGRFAGVAEWQTRQT